LILKSKRASPILLNAFSWARRFQAGSDPLIGLKSVSEIEQCADVITVNVLDQYNAITYICHEMVTE
jgi:hypothetical protein